MIKLDAAAKVNLGLEVIGRREDGYHDLRSILVSVDLADQVEIGAGEGIDVTGAFAGDVPSDETNLALRALGELERRAGHALGRRLRIEKRIPARAGLGGGSADAAAVLRAARQLGVEVPPADLAALAMGLGADVPFQLVGGIAAVGGAGEELEPLPYRELHIALAVSAARVSTAAVFAELREEEWGDGGAVDAAIAALRTEDSSAALRTDDSSPGAREGGTLADLLAALPNGLEAAAFRVEPRLTQDRDLLREAGWSPRLTGTGSAFIQVCASAGEAAQRAAAARAIGLTAWSVRSLPAF